MSYWGYIILSIWLILTALISLFHIQFPRSSQLLPVLCLIAGILMVTDAIKARFKHNFGGLFLSVWLIGSGVQQLFRLHNLSPVLPLIALTAGVLLLFKK